MLRPITALIATLSLTACVETAVTQTASNQFLLSTSAAPVCGRTGAMKVASQMAAVETLRRGYPRFVILGAASQNNVSVINRAPTYAYTNSTYSGYGNTLYGNSTTTFGGGGPMIVGSNDADMNVLMLRPGDPGFERGVDARTTLGAEWEQLVKSGIKGC